MSHGVVTSSWRWSFPTYSRKSTFRSRVLSMVWMWCILKLSPSTLECGTYRVLGPVAGRLFHCWVNILKTIRRWRWQWTSSTFSACFMLSECEPHHASALPVLMLRWGARVEFCKRSMHILAHVLDFFCLVVQRVVLGQKNADSRRLYQSLLTLLCFCGIWRHLLLSRQRACISAIIVRRTNHSIGIS